MNGGGLIFEEERDEELTFDGPNGGIGNEGDIFVLKLFYEFFSV